MKKLLLPADWDPPKGYSNGVLVEGSRWLFLGGQIGWNAQQEFESDDFVAQFEQTLQNVVAVLAAGGATPEHLVRLTWYITDRTAYLASLRDVGRVYREVIGKHYPPMTVVEVKSLVEERAKVEIEATAVLPD